jgi:hypothetical protein
MTRLLALALVLTACIGSGPNCELGNCDDLVMAQCLGPSLEDILRAHGGIAALLDSLGDAPPASTTFDVATGEYTITILIGPSVVTLTGIVSSPDELGDGLTIGEEATATWEMDGFHPGAFATGDGSFQFMRSSATGFTVTGSGSIADDEGCELDVTSLDLTESSSSDFGVGMLVFSGRSSAGTITGTVTFDGTEGADIAAQFKGEVRMWTFHLPTGSVFLEP